jgi:hypothetical protein
MVTVTAEARVVGGRPHTGMGVVDIELPANRIRVADLIRVMVEEQVRTLTARRKLSIREIEQRLTRQFGADPERKTVQLGAPQLDIEDEVQRALNACRRGTCLVVVDGRPIESLDEEVVIASGSSIRFLRVVPLAGG